MKRSEMVSFMWEFIQNVENDYDRYMTKDYTEELLAIMEEKGIFPPEWDNYNPDQVSRTFSSDRDWGRGEDGPNGEYRSYLKQKTWEPENE